VQILDVAHLPPSSVRNEPPEAQALRTRDFTYSMTARRMQGGTCRLWRWSRLHPNLSALGGWRVAANGRLAPGSPPTSSPRDNITEVPHSAVALLNWRRLHSRRLMTTAPAAGKIKPGPAQALSSCGARWRGDVAKPSRTAILHLGAGQLARLRLFGGGWHARCRRRFCWR